MTEFAKVSGKALALLLALAAVPSVSEAQQKILVYTRNYTPDGKGYVHENIAASVAAIKKMGEEKGFAVDVSDDANSFTDANLKQYSALVFSNSNNEAFATEDQKSAFKNYIQHGGGFVGIHSATGSQRDWPYYWSVVGGKFVAHPKLQPFVVKVADTSFAAAKGLPAEFQWEDEPYFIDHVNPDIHPVLVIDRKKLLYMEATKLEAETFANPLPLAWYHRFDGGREFYVALGHKKEDYANPILYGIIENGILWAMGGK
ncbi:MAG: ThuA domain-containing protein [bacterium]